MYIGTQPYHGFRARHTYTATAGQTSFSGAGAENVTLTYSDEMYIDVYQNGVKLSPADYTATSGTTVVLATGATVSDIVEVVKYDAFSVADTVSAKDGGGFGGNISTSGTLAVTGTSTLTGNVTAAGTLAVTGNTTVGGTLGITGNTTFTADIIKSTSGTSNFAAGVNAGNSIASGGNYNVVIGDEAGTALTTGDNNVAIGFEALNTEDGNGLNVAVGFRSLKTLNAGADGENTAVGNNTGLSMTTAVYNTVVGSQAGDALTDGSSNTAIGMNALTADTRGQNSIAVGRNALFAQNFTSSTDSYNVAIGRDAGASITTGDKNTIVGNLAGDGLTTGNKNTVLGYNALGAGTTYDGNTAIGHDALRVAENTSGADGNNVGVGASAANALTSGLRNVIIGVSAGASLHTGNDNICIGKGADVSANAAANQITIGNDIDAGGNNNFSFGKASNIVTNDFDSDANWSRSSDRRKKREIYDQELGLDFVNDLRTVNFQWKPSNEFPKEWNDYSEENNMDTDVVMHGFIAQEVKDALDKHSSERDSKFSGWKEGEDGMQHTSREMFVIPLIKAVQELSAQVDTLKAEIKELKNE